MAICYEILNGQPAPAPNPDARFIIVNNASQTPQQPFYAILVQGIPKLMHLLETDLQQVDAMGMGDFDLVAVNIDGVTAMIPNLELLEEYVTSTL